jgi:CDP-paratose 2-epimerase
MKLLVTGCGGLIGSAVAELALSRGWAVTGIDGDFRGRWFGVAGSVEWRLKELASRGVRVIHDDFRHHIDKVKGMDAVVHCASQPSHDYSRSHVVVDSAVNYMGTVQLLEMCRTLAPEAAFVFLSTNKVYGDVVNGFDYRVDGERLVPTQGAMKGFHPNHGISEDYRIDQSLHTPFGVSKTAADLMVQEYRHCFDLKTVTLRCGCLTGKNGSPVELQGFLGYLVRCAGQGKPYTIYGHEGYQVRDNLDAEDLAEAILLAAQDPKDCVYNMGGGPENAVSVNEVIAYLKAKGCEFEVKHGPARLGDHRWWVTDTRKFQRDFPEWRIKKTVHEVIDEMVGVERSRRVVAQGHATVPAGALEETRVQ